MPKPPTPDRIMQMASAFYDSCVLFAACDLGVFVKIAELGRADAQAVSQSLGLHARGTRLLLDACVALELLEKRDDTYGCTLESMAFLVPGSPGDFSKALGYNRDVYPAWGRLPELIKNGRPMEKPEIHLGDDPERTRTFVLAMHHRALGIGQAVVPLLSLAGKKTLLDVGGGPGTYSVLLTQRNPELTCTVLDLPAVVAIADQLIRQQGMAARVKTLAGNYRTATFPRGNDAIIFFGVLHQESPDSIQTLLMKAFNALNAGGVVYVMDLLTDATHTLPKFSALFALNMALTSAQGWVFSDNELRGWLAHAGFAGFTVQPLPPPMPHWLAVGHKPA